MCTRKRKRNAVLWTLFDPLYSDNFVGWFFHVFGIVKKSLIYYVTANVIEIVF